MANLNEDVDSRLLPEIDVPSRIDFNIRNVVDLISQTTNDDNGDLVSKIIRDDVKEEHYSFKCSIIPDIAEAIIVEGRPMFLQVTNGFSTFKEHLRLGNLLKLPPSKDMYLTKEYTFSSGSEIDRYIERANKENFESLFKKVKDVWKKYFDADDDVITLCAADTIFTYFQDKLGMTHYLLFVGGNNMGKTSALKIFNELAYRPLYDVSLTQANIYRFLGTGEEGNGVILEDEIDDISKEPEKMKIYKVGYQRGAKVTRLGGSRNNNTKSKMQQSYNTFCFKAFGSESQPDFVKARGFIERLLIVKCFPGSPLYDIAEVVNSQGKNLHRKLYREMEDLRKLLLIYRLIHFKDNLGDVQLSIKGRDSQLCKPLILLFKDTNIKDQILEALSKFISEKSNKKLNSFESYLYLIISNLITEEVNSISNEELWNKVVSGLSGSNSSGTSFSYQSDEFGRISKRQLTIACEDKFGAHREHDGKKRLLIFNRSKLMRLKETYSNARTTEMIKVLDTPSLSADSDDNFNAFWKWIESYGRGRLNHWTESHT
jgi:hypothetical protein